MQRTAAPRSDAATVRRFGIVLILGALALVGAFAIVAAFRPVAREGSTRVITIPPGASVREIAARLADARLIRSPVVFILAARLRGVGGRLQHGEFALSPAMSTVEILDRIVRGEIVLHGITIPEGYTAARIADGLARAGLADREEFLRLVREEGGSFPFAFLQGRRNLEGYLFPDTYRFPRDLPARQIIHQMLVRFDERVAPELRARPPSPGVSLFEALIIASMVEREAKVAPERPIIAGVIYNRLQRGWRLEIDATILYALGRHADRVTASDLEVDSPYNTYRHGGLPPGPICNPGLAAIRAALRPATTPYLFYVLRPDGTHAFSRTYQEHLQAIRRWRP